MFDDINRTLEALLKSELPADIANQVSISFATPDETFPPNGVTLPAINLFLFEIHENPQLRETEPALERRPDGRVVKVPAPVRVDCHYLVTAVAAQQIGSEQDEHHILGAALKVLLRHRILPDAILRGELAGKAPPMRAITIQQGVHPSGIELWQSLKGKPRACLHYTLTVPVDVAVPEDAGPPVTSMSIGGG